MRPPPLPRECSSLVSHSRGGLGEGDRAAVKTPLWAVQGHLVTRPFKADSYVITYTREHRWFGSTVCLKLGGRYQPILWAEGSNSCLPRCGKRQAEHGELPRGQGSLRIGVEGLPRLEEVQRAEWNHLQHEDGPRGATQGVCRDGDGAGAIQLSAQITEGHGGHSETHGGPAEANQELEMKEAR